MPNIASVLKDEITRLARKEVRADVQALRKLGSTHRSEIAALKRQVQALHSELNRLAKRQASDSKVAASARADADEVEHAGQRFSAKGLAANRKRLGLSAEEFGALIGVTGQSIYAWESGRTKPRPGAVAQIASLRGIGKKAVQEKLQALGG